MAILLKGWCYIPDFIIKQHSKETIYEQIIFQIKLLIANGELSVGDSLPSVRNLAKSLEVSTLSVQRAYTELQQDGIIESVEGKGNFVAQGLNKSSLRDALLREVEDEAKKIIQIAKQNGVELKELHELLTILWEDN
ncbi:MAG: GntR family transcriptional regulator [Defluviitaleaceae bacterium]|nr:GntR family transcriptional regulator [Defluviitaleaceae bacterium]